MKFFSIKTTAIAVVFLCALQNGWSAETNEVKSQQTIYLALSDQHGVPGREPQEIFSCTDKVYSVVELTDIPEGKHHLSVRWFDPSDTVREHTRYEFNVRNKSTRLWAWLSLSRGFGAGMLQWVNPAAGLEEFVGIWKIEVEIDGKGIGEDTFEVSC